MRFTDFGARALAGFAACALACLPALLPGTAWGADASPLVMKFTFPTINDQVHQFAKNYAAALEKDSGGRIKAELYPASQLGSIPRQIEGVQFGAIQCAIIPPEFFVGIDERFQLLAAPGLVTSFAHGQRIAADAAVRKLMLGLGANKGLRGVGLFFALPSSVIAKSAIRHLADFKGKKIRIFASDFQKLALERLGATPVAMSLSDVLPAIQQGAIDGAVSGLTVYTTMHYQDAAKYVTDTGQPAIFLIVELSAKWRDGLPEDLRKIVDQDAARESVAINTFDASFYAEQRKVWVERGGELINLPPDEQSAMMEEMGNVGEVVAKDKPALADTLNKIVAEAKRLR